MIRMDTELLAQFLAGASRQPLSPAALRMVDSAHVPILAFDGDGLQIYENVASAKLLGHEQGELDGQHVLHIVAHEPEWILSEFARLKTQKRWRGLVSMRHKLDEPLLVEGKAVESHVANQPPLYVGLLRTLAPAADAFGARGVSAYGLSTHESIVLQLMAEGLTDKDMALILGVSVWTIHKQVAEVLRKMDATSRTLASVRAIKQGLA